VSSVGFDMDYLGDSREVVMDISVTTSTTNTKLFDMKSMEQAASYADERAKGVASLFSQKIGEIKDTVVVFPISSELFKVMAQTLQPFIDVSLVEREEWKADLKLPDKKFIVFTEYKDSPLEDWIKRGIIKKEHWIMATAMKDEARKKLFSESCNFIDMWVNAQMQAGLKFPDCDKYHRVSQEIIKDNDVVYANGADDCKCGVKGSTFTV
jgi:hypothetical protein